MIKLFFSSLFVNVVVMALHFSTGILSARNLGPEGRGELAVVTRWSSLIGMLLMLGLPIAVTFLGKQKPEKQREYFGAFLFLGSSIGVVGAILGQFVFPTVLANQSGQVVSLVCLSLATLPMVLLADGLIGTMTTLNIYRRVLFLRFFSPFGTLLLILGLVAAQQYSVGSFVYGNLIWSAAFFVLNLALTFHAIRPSFRSLWTRCRELLRKGRQIYMPSLVTVFGDNLDQIVISLFLTPLVLGFYAVAGSIGSILPSVVLGALGVFLLPKLMDLRGAQKRRMVERIHALVFYGSIVVTAVGILLLPLLLPALYGKEFSSAVTMGAVLLGTAPFRIGYNVLTNFLSSEDKFRFVTEAEIVGLVLGVVVTLGLLGFAEGVGAAIGVAVAGVAKWIYIAVRAAKLGVDVSAMFKLDLSFLFASLKSLASWKPVKVRESD